MFGYIVNVLVSWLCYRFQYRFKVEIAEKDQILDMKYMELPSGHCQLISCHDLHHFVASCLLTLHLQVSHCHVMPTHHSY
jgi:hypothetical protein